MPMGDDVVEGMVPGESMADMAPTPHYLPWSRPHPSQEDTKTWTCRNCQCRNPLAIQRCSTLLLLHYALGCSVCLSLSCLPHLASSWPSNGAPCCAHSRVVAPLLCSHATRSL